MIVPDVRAHRWAIVLAAGNGTRLGGLARRDGRAVPKQYCTLAGGRTLLGDALARAERLVDPGRVVTIVAEEHRPLWLAELAARGPTGVVVQPENRGTAAGVLLPLLAILERDPEARVAILPSDHFVADEARLARSLRRALDTLDAPLDAEGTVATLLGVEPVGPETSYGWIVPAARGAGVRGVERFVEKPGADVAASLLARGGLWNAFLLAARGAELLELFERRLPELVLRLGAVFTAPPRRRAELLELAYGALPSADFSRDVLQGAEPALRCLAVPPCGWTDLGTPERVAECLAGMRRARTATPRTGGPLDLAAALERWRPAVVAAAGMA